MAVMVLLLVNLGVFVSGSGKCDRHQGDPSLRGVHDKRCDGISVGEQLDFFGGEQPDRYDKVIHNSHLGEAYATHSRVCELKVILYAFLQLSNCVLL